MILKVFFLQFGHL